MKKHIINKMFIDKDNIIKMDLNTLSDDLKIDTIKLFDDLKAKGKQIFRDSENIHYIELQHMLYLSEFGVIVFVKDKK